MKTAIYCRVSTEEQASGGHSIEAQRQELSNYCKALNNDIYDYYIDAGYSASTMERPALQKLLADATQFDVVMVWRLDRISRDMSDLMMIIEIFNNNNVSLKSKTESFDTSSASGKLMLNMLGSFAEFERASISERIKLAHKKILNEGKWRGGKPPYGYDIAEDNTLVINEKEAEVIATIFDLSANKNIGTRTIAIELNNMGFTTRNGKPFNSSYITRILNNPTYFGEMIHGKQQTIKKEGKKVVIYNDKYDTYAGNFIPIISKDLFMLSQEKLKKRKQNRGTSNTIENLLSGKVYCGECKDLMVRGKSRSKGSFFVCRSYKYYGKCYHNYVSEKRILREIKKVINNFKQDKEHLLDFNKQILKRKQDKFNNLRIRINYLNVDIRDYENREDKLLDIIEKGLINDKEFVKRKQKLAYEKELKINALKDTEIELENIVKEKGDKEFIYQIESMDKEFERLSLVAKKKLLNNLVERIEIYKGEKSYARKQIHIYFKI